MRTLRRTVSVFAVGAGLVSGLTGCVNGAAGESSGGGVDGVSPPDLVDASSEVPTPLRLALVSADTPPPPLSGGTLAVSSDGTVAVAADPDRDLVYVVTFGNRASKTLQLPAGSEPGRVAIDAANRAHVALRGTGRVVSVDTRDASLIAQTAVCSSPRGIGYDARNDTLLVACVGGELVTLSAGSHAKIASAQLGLDLRDVVVGDDGVLAVSRYRRAELLRLGADGGVLGTTAPAQQKQTRFVSGKVEREGDLIAPAPAEPTTVNMSPALAWKTVGNVDGSMLMLHQLSQDDEVVIQDSGGYGGGCETITQAGLTFFHADGTPGVAASLAPHGLVVDVAVSPDGKWIALAEPGGYLQGNPTVEVIAKSNIGTPVFFDAGAPPVADAGVAPGADAGIAFDEPTNAPLEPIGFDAGAGAVSCLSGTSSGGDIQATSVAYDGNGALFVFSREPAELVVFEPESDDNVFGGWAALVESDRFKLANNSVRDTGHELFHADVGNGLSCAGCHGEALDDGHVWNFRDFGPRRTQTMRGGLLSTLPLHWEGDLPDFKHLVDEVMTRRMGGFKVEPKFASALATWIDTLPPLQLGTSETAPADAVQRGKALFESEEVACASCHSGTHFTNNKSVDVGTEGVFQVPTLLGVGLHPPFMHDGCAETMAERFEPSCGGGDKHGHTSQLDAREIADLVSYLNTL
jgi:mono/diheme cytochrome c family protein